SQPQPACLDSRHHPCPAYILDVSVPSVLHRHSRAALTSVTAKQSQASKKEPLHERSLSQARRQITVDFIRNDSRVLAKSTTSA
ncbi:hypothetical protein BGZ91_008005, partial [Linnemannia elongata]